MENIDSVLSQQIDLPSAPAIVALLTATMSREDVGSREIARIVETDQGFTARTLKLVNSPFFGLARQITSVDEAIAMVGIRSLQQLLLGTSVITSLGTEGSSLSMDDFWMHSFSVGVIAKCLRPGEGTENQQEAFMCGVLHDIGRLLFAKTSPERYERFCDDGQSVIDLDKEAQWFGADHQRLGQALAQKWNFPAKFVNAIGFHHSPDDAPDFSALLAAIHIADITCHGLNLGRSGNQFVSSFSPASWEKLGLNEDKFENAVRKALREIEETESVIRSIG